MSKILVCIPIKPGINPILSQKCHELLSALPGANPSHEIAIYVDSLKVAGVTKKTPWSTVCCVRNAMLERIRLDAWDFLLWIDADVVHYPATLPTDLLAGTPNGISAPFVLIEDTPQFYDTCAFIEKGSSHLQPEKIAQMEGRNLQAKEPYWSKPPTSSLVPMDCVGTVTMVPASVYRAGARYEDHPSFTDHFPICSKALEMGLQVNVDRNLIALHADLPKYGEAWH